MEDKLLTTDELAERWQVVRGTIDDYRKQGIIKPCEGVPVIRFAKQHILELEGVKLDKLSPLERKRLENENKQLKEENKELHRMLISVFGEMNDYFNFMNSYKEG